MKQIHFSKTQNILGVMCLLVAIFFYGFYADTPLFNCLMVAFCTTIFIGISIDLYHQMKQAMDETEDISQGVKTIQIGVLILYLFGMAIIASFIVYFILRLHLFDITT
jgi:hypothetical protein